jgi:lipid-A-disaccharide synthase
LRKRKGLALRRQGKNPAHPAAIPDRKAFLVKGLSHRAGLRKVAVRGAVLIAGCSMTEVPDVSRVFISAAEQSADEHAAGLIAAFRRRDPRCEFVGLAGPRMRAAGCRGLTDLTGRATMLTSVVGGLPRALAVLSRVDRFLSREPVDAAVLVDSGTLHLPMARRCQARGVPVFYFIAPQTWASREWRVRAIRDRVDRLATILPFEEAYFRSHGVSARYVGHPLFDRLTAQPVDAARVAALRGDARPVIVLLPGSRRQVVREVLPGQLDVARDIAARFRWARFLLAAANERMAAEARRIIARRGDIPTIRVEADHRAELIRAADLALVASGTATLEVAYHRAPMIVMYNARLARLCYPLLRGWMIKTQLFALPNILAGRRIVPEFMPFYRGTSEIAVAALELLSSVALQERMKGELAALMEPLARPGASAAVAEELAALLRERGRRRRRGPVGSRHRVW